MAPAGYDDDPPPDGPADDSSLFDELFVAGAQFQEETAAQRAARAEEARREERSREQQAKRQEKREKVASRFGRKPSATTPSGGRRALAFGLFGAVVLITWLLGGHGGPSEEAQQAEGTERETTQTEGTPRETTSRPDTVRVTHAIPSDVQSTPLAVDTLRTEIDIASRWLASQTGGRTLRFAEEGAEVAIAEQRLSITSAELASRTDAAVTIQDELRHGEGGDDVIRLVFAPVRFPDKRCGETSGTLVIIWVGSCDADPSAAIAEFGDGTTTVIAHELMHALGAVESCAPNHGRDGHVTDDPTDLMYVGQDAAPGPGKVLDPGRDDYFEHGNDGCWDIARHPVWRD